MESQLEKTQKCVEDKHRISINIDAQSLQEINTEPQSVKPHKGLYPKLTKACTQNSQRRVPKTHKGLYPKLTKACTQNSQRLVPKTVSSESPYISKQLFYRNVLDCHCK